MNPFEGRPVSEERFLRGFLAALKLSGVDFVDTRDDVHHRKFAHALQLLDAERMNGSAAAALMPVTLTPSPFTGRFAALDAALLGAQSAGNAGARNPFYPGADLSGTRPRMQAILDRFSVEQRALLVALAEEFINEGRHGSQGSDMGSALDAGSAAAR